MANTSDSISHRHDHHDWDSDEYVSNWAKGQDPKEKDRHAAFTLLADTIPFSKDRPIRILDLGAGYGALTQLVPSTALAQARASKHDSAPHEHRPPHCGLG